MAYRYDSSGMDASWNGGWISAVSVADDRWFLELRVPVQDLGIQRVAPTEGWRLNLCCNQPGGNTTWAAVGNNFHHPDAFGELVAQAFAMWHEAQPQQWKQKQAAILQAAGAHASRYTDRLTAIESAGLSGVTHDPAADWKAITRAFARSDFIGSAYRRVEEEVRYGKFFE
ncbi:MAG: hypothetical protein NTY19_19990 [Planctomycetota bacterium]|nr:hypothetical protein [Planctomycetota bacterium]